MGYGFGSLGSIPYLRTYEEAEKRLNNTRPIRGTNPPEYRLGDRRDKHLRINKNANGDIECILYQTPVVIFKGDGSGNVVINPKQHTSQFTCAFISALLPHVQGRHVRGNMVVTVAGMDYPLSENQTLTLRWDGVNFVVAHAEGVWTWTINRAAANNVRKPFKKFLQFYKGFVALNARTLDDSEIDDVDDPFTVKQTVHLSAELIEQVLGVRMQEEKGGVWNPQTKTMSYTLNTYKAVNTDGWNLLSSKPVYGPMIAASGETRKAMEIRAQWEQQREYLCSLMRSDSTEDHLKATLIVMWSNSAFLVKLSPQGKTLARSKADQLPFEMLTMMFAEEVLDYVRAPVGRVPHTEYGQYLYQEVLRKKVKQAREAAGEVVGYL